MIRNVSLFFATALFGTFLSAGAQQTTPPTFFDKQIARFDLGVSAVSIINQTVSGTVQPKNGGTAPNLGQTLSDDPSNTVGALANIRYVVKPMVGFEFNFLYSRLTENFCCSVPVSGVTGVNYGLQSQANEITLGYVVTPKVDVFGFQPYASVGAGTTEFKPTKGGGEGERVQARMTYYYSGGLQKQLLSNFGLRVGFRETFLMAPDYGDNYLSIYQHTHVIEPNFGFYLHF